MTIWRTFARFLEKDFSVTEPPAIMRPYVKL